MEGTELTYTNLCQQCCIFVYKNEANKSIIFGCERVILLGPNFGKTKLCVLKWDLNLFLRPILPSDVQFSGTVVLRAEGGIALIVNLNLNNYVRLYGSLFNILWIIDILNLHFEFDRPFKKRKSIINHFYSHKVNLCINLQ